MSETTAPVLGRYKIISELGEGGFANAYRALDTLLERQVALKVLKPVWANDPNVVNRFMREARQAARLSHPNIVTIHDVGRAVEADGRLFIAMELVPGRSLQRFVAEEGPLSLERALPILEQAASALDYAHQQGLIHRDVKPANILLNESVPGTVKAVLTDFGLVRAAEQSSSVSLSVGGILGTPEYIAPEIWDGQPATAASDLYGLACVVHYVLTGQVLFSGPTPMAILKRHLDGPVFPKQWPTTVPQGAVQVLQQALSRDPAKRPATASEMVAELKYALQAAAQEAQKAEEAEQRARAEAQRKAGEAEHLARQAAERRAKDEEAARAARQEAERKAAEEQARASKLEAQRRAAEEQARLASLETERRAAQEQARLAQLEAQRKTAAVQPPAEQAARTPAQAKPAKSWRRRIILGAIAVIVVCCLLAYFLISILPHYNTISVSFGPDGSWLASGSDKSGKLRLWKTSDGSLVHEWSVSSPNSIAVSPDGSMVASGGYGGLSLWSTSDGTLVRACKEQTGTVQSVTFSPRGGSLASADRAGAVRLWKVGDGSLLREMRVNTYTIESVAFSPDGSLLASGSDDKTVRLWKVSDGSLVRELTGHTYSVASVAFSPDGEFLASGGIGEVRLWNISDGSLVREWKDSSESVAFSPDGSLLASGTTDKTVKLWKISDGSLVRELKGHTNWVVSVAFSPDGSLLASGSWDGTARLWKVSDGSLVRELNAGK